MDENYSYDRAGFSPFLTRSIDDRAGGNLDALSSEALANNRELNYDQSPTTGFLGSTLRLGNINLDGVSGEITVVDDAQNEVVRVNSQGVLISEKGKPRGQLGFKDNEFAIKVSQKGEDVTSAADSKMVLNSNFNSFKIVAANTVTITPTALAGTYSATYEHNLGFVPAFVAYWVFDGNTYLTVPRYSFTAGGSLGWKLEASATKTLFQVDFFYLAASTDGFPNNITVKFYLLIETAS